MRSAFYLLSLVVGLSVTAQTRAALLITVADAPNVVVGSGTVDLVVNISGTDSLQAFQVTFNITGGTNTHMEFVNQSLPGDGPTLGNPAYVFFADSAAKNPPASSFGNASGGPPFNTTFIGGDFTNSFSNVNIESTNNILAVLRLTVPSNLSSDGQNTFTIRLDTDPNKTSFTNIDTGPLSIDSTSKLSGNITIISAPTTAAVPEPSTLAGACLAVATSLFAVRCRNTLSL